MTEHAGRRPDLGSEVVRRFAAGALSPERFQAAFASASVYCLRGPRPCLVASGETGAGVIAVFSSLAELARHVVADPGWNGQGADWFSTTGADLLGQWPVGYTLVLDPAGEHPVHLDREAVTRQTVLAVRRREEGGD